MKKKYVVIPIVIALVALIFVYCYFSFNNKNNKLNVREKRWLDNNSSSVVDFDVYNNYPVYGLEGTGVVFDLLDYIEDETGLEFNRVPILNESEISDSGYNISVVDNDIDLDKNQYLIYEDSYVAISREGKNIVTESDINNSRLGVLSSDQSEVSYYLRGSSNLTYLNYDSSDDLFKALDTKKIDYVIVPYMMYLNKTISSTKYFVNYYFSNINKKIVLTVNGKDNTLNNIIIKKFNAWQKNEYVKDYNNELLDYYLLENSVTDKLKTELNSKSYVYGYVENKPYEITTKKGAGGIALEYIDRMSRLTNVEFTYKKYKNTDELKKAVSNGDVDIYFDYYGIENGKYQSTVSPFIERYVVLGRVKDNHVVTSFESLKKVDVKLLSNNLIANYFDSNSRANITTVPTIKKLTKNDGSLIVADKELYEYYKNSKFSDYEVLYTDITTNDYTFKVNYNDSTFYRLFNYIINTNSYYKYRNMGLNNLTTSNIDTTSFKTVFLYVFTTLFALFMAFCALIVVRRHRRKVKVVKREDRVKYTDLLTSLKNRNYLNLNIKKWDDCKVFPQAVIVVDLNNVQYVNENHGYEAGDDLIIKAASILVNTQLENSEIMRTDGNEFLIYAIGYSESQIETYSKKLNKEFKKLPYEFGASLGYSMVKDEIKTIDDAISEATLEMKTKKEEYK